MAPRTLILVASAATALAIGANAARAQNANAQAGVAAAVRGSVTLVAAVPQQARRAIGEDVQSGDPIFLGDTIETGPEAGLQIILMDETYFTIGPDAALIIDEFVYDPATSAGKVTASVLKGAFRFVSGKVAKDEPRNMSVKTPVGTIGIRGTAAAGRVVPADPGVPGSQPSADIVLLGPGVDNNANERAGRIIVSNANTSVEIARSGFGTRIGGVDIPPSVPVRFEPGEVASLTGALGTTRQAAPAGDGAPGTPANSDGSQNGDGQDGSARDGNQQDGGDQAGQQGQDGEAGDGQNAQGPGPQGGENSGDGNPPAAGNPAAARGPNAGQQANAGPAAGTGGLTGTGAARGSAGPSVAGRAQIGLNQANALSGQNIGTGVVGAGILGQIATAQDPAQQTLLTAIENNSIAVNTAIATFDQLRAINTGTATFNFGTINLNYVSGAHTNSGGSYNASAVIDFAARTIDLKIENVSYFFNGGAGQLFVYKDDVGGGVGGTYSTDTGTVGKTWTTSSDPSNFPTAPTDGSTAEVTGQIRNNLDTGVVAAFGRVNVKISDSGSTTVISGGKTVNRQ